MAVSETDHVDLHDLGTGGVVHTRGLVVEAAPSAPVDLQHRVGQAVILDDRVELLADKDVVQVAD